ncbi:MAG: hypothetical protein IJC93_01135 [Clostridia bacterium]|nr:hypothetical protein [Clostridia bacterium]
MKKTTSILLVFMMLALLCSPAYAALPETVQPLWDNTSDANVWFSFSNLDNSAEGYVIGKAGTTKITVRLSIYVDEDGEWVLLGGNTESVNGSNLSVDKSFNAVSGKYYKAVLTFMVTKNGVMESDRVYAYATCP